VQTKSHKNKGKEGGAYPDGVMIVPSDLFGELAKEAVLVPRLQPQNPTRQTRKCHQTRIIKKKSVNNSDAI